MDRRLYFAKAVVMPGCEPGCTVNAVDYLQPYLISLVMNRKNLTAVVTAFLYVKEMKLTS